jgi:hypothetical protein
MPPCLGRDGMSSSARGELTRAILLKLRDSARPLSAENRPEHYRASWGGPRDRKYLPELEKRVSKALRQQRDVGTVRSIKDSRRNFLWCRKSLPQEADVKALDLSLDYLGHASTIQWGESRRIV